MNKQRGSNYDGNAMMLTPNTPGHTFEGNHD